MSDEHNMLTLPELARELGKTERQLDYCSRTRGIKETRRAGGVRLFDQEAAAQLRDAVASIDRDKSVRA